METLDAEELELKRKLEDADTLEERREIRRQLRELRNRRFDEELKKVSAGDYKSSRGSSLTNGTDSSGSARTAVSQPSKLDDQEDIYGLSKIDNEDQLQELLNDTPYTETDKRRKIRARLREIRNAKFSIGEPVETKRSHRSGSERTADEKVNGHSASSKISDVERVSSSSKDSELAKEKERERQMEKEKEEERKREKERQKEKEREEEKERERQEREREREEQKERERQEREREEQKEKERQERERKREEQKERERQEREREREEQKERERQEREREEQKERERQERERKREEQKERERQEREREREEQKERERQEREREREEQKERQREEEREKERQLEKEREEEREKEGSKRAESKEYGKGIRLPKEELKKDIKRERNNRENDDRDKLKNGHASEDQKGSRNRQSSADAESEDDTYYLRGPSKRGGIRKTKDEVDRDHESVDSSDQPDIGYDNVRPKFRETKGRPVDDFDESDLQETGQDFVARTQTADYEADENTESRESARTWSETSSQEGSGSHDYDDDVRSQGERSIDSADFSSRKPTVSTEGPKTDIEEVLKAKEPGLEGGFKSKLRKSGRKFEQKQTSGAEQVDFRNQLRKKVAPTQVSAKTVAGGEQVDFRSVLQRPVKTRADSKPAGGEQVDFRTVLKQGAVTAEKKEAMGAEQVDFRTVLKKSEADGSISPVVPGSPVLERAGSAKAGKKPPPAPPKTKTKPQKSSSTDQSKQDHMRTFSSSDGSSDVTQELGDSSSEKTTASHRDRDVEVDNETFDPEDASEEIETQDLPDTETRPETEVDLIEENEKRTDEDCEEAKLQEEHSSRTNSVSLNDQEEDEVLSDSQHSANTGNKNADAAFEDSADGIDAEEPPSVEGEERRKKSDSTASTDDTDAAPKGRTFSHERTYSKERSGSKTEELKSKLEAKAGGKRNTFEEQTKKKETAGSIEQRMAERRRQRVMEQRKKDLERRSNRMAFKEQLEKNSPKPVNQASRTPLQRTNSNMNKLLNWAQRLTASYEGITVTDFSGSWADGMAFCALLDNFAPDKIQFYELDPNAKRHNLELAFRVAAEEGVPELLEADDFMRMKKPDPKCVATYLNSVYQILVAERQ